MCSNSIALRIIELNSKNKLFIIGKYFKEFYDSELSSYKLNWKKIYIKKSY